MQININNVKRRKPQADITNSEKWVRNKNEMNAGPQLMHVMVCVCVRVWVSWMHQCVCICLCAAFPMYEYACSWRNKHVCVLLIVANFVSSPAFISAFGELSLISWAWVQNMFIGKYFRFFSKSKICLLENIFAIFHLLLGENKFNHRKIVYN